MNKNGGPWGTYLGKIIAACLVLAFVFGTVALCLSFEKQRDLQMDYNDFGEKADGTKDLSFSIDGTNVVMRFKLNFNTQRGYYFSGFDTYREDGQLVLKMYTSIKENKAFPEDEDGYYEIYIPFEKGDKSLAFEGEDGLVSSLYEIKK